MSLTLYFIHNQLFILDITPAFENTLPNVTQGALQVLELVLKNVTTVYINLEELETFSVCGDYII